MYTTLYTVRPGSQDTHEFLCIHYLLFATYILWVHPINVYTVTFGAEHDASPRLL